MPKTKLEAPCKGCEQRNERCHIKCDKYRTYRKAREEYNEYEREADGRLNSIISALQATNCRRRNFWR